MLRFLRSIFRRVPGDSPQLAIERFHRHQIDLHAAFYSLAASSGTPRDLNWLSCEWLEEFQLARESTTGLITLLTAVNVRFTAVEGGDMEDVAAVNTVRNGTAIFHYQNGRWGTGGRVLFNLTPAQVTERMPETFQQIAVE